MLGVQCHTPFSCSTSVQFDWGSYKSLCCVLLPVSLMNLLWLDSPMPLKKLLAEPKLFIKVRNLVSPWTLGSFHPRLATIGKTDIISSIVWATKGRDVNTSSLRLDSWNYSSIERYNFKYLYNLLIKIDCSHNFSCNFGLIASVWLKQNRQRRLPLLSNPLTFEWLIRSFLPALCG